MDPKKYSIIINKEYLSFSIAHFVLFSDTCEGLHGHNYRVETEISGSLDRIGYVLDFSYVKPVLKKICDMLDHKVVLPGNNDALEITDAAEGTEVQFKGKRFCFPPEDVLILPLKNTSAEHFAEFICDEMLKIIGEKRESLRKIKVTVYESPGQAACFTRDLGSQGP